MSKVLESVLLTCFQSRGDYDDSHQFDFKRKHSTTLACSALQTLLTLPLPGNLMKLLAYWYSN